MTRKIKLTKGQVALVDDKDYNWLNQWNWRAQRGPRTYYAVRNRLVGDKRDVPSQISMHRVILNAPNNMLTDHKDRNGLNNRRANLRLCTRAQNLQNRPKHRKGSSPYKGVCKCGKKLRWRAYMKPNGKHRHLGYFGTEIEAAKAYDNAAYVEYGEFAFLNFKDEKDGKES